MSATTKTDQDEKKPAMALGMPHATLVDVQAAQVRHARYIRLEAIARREPLVRELLADVARLEAEIEKLEAAAQEPAPEKRKSK